MKGLRGVQARTVFLVVILFACLVSLSSCGSEPNSWINLKPSGAQPSARFGQALVYVADSGKLVMFGGAIDEENPLNETWVYERDRNTWTDLKPSGELPPARRSMAAAYDPGANKIVVFGGMGAGGEILKDTWMYDVPKNTWTALAPSSPPSARYGAKMVYDPASGRLLLFGGTYLRTSATASFQQDFNDTWAFDLAAATWTGLSPSGTPPAPRDEGAESMIYNERAARCFFSPDCRPFLTS